MKDWREMTPEAFDKAAKPQPLSLFAADSQGNLTDLFSGEPADECE